MQLCHIAVRIMHGLELTEHLEMFAAEGKGRVCQARDSEEEGRTGK